MIIQFWDYQKLDLGLSKTIVNIDIILRSIYGFYNG